MFGGLGWVVDPSILVWSPLGVSLHYLIHSSDGWSCVSVVYSLGVGPKGPTLVRFHLITIKNKTEYIFLYYNQFYWEEKENLSFSVKIIFSVYEWYCLPKKNFIHENCFIFIHKKWNSHIACSSFLNFGNKFSGLLCLILSQALNLCTRTGLRVSKQLQVRELYGNVTLFS